MQLFSKSGVYVVKKLGFKRGTHLSAYTQLYVAFFLSGVLHYAGDQAMMRGTSLASGSIAFFLRQATLIMFEVRFFLSFSHTSLSLFPYMQN